MRLGRPALGGDVLPADLPAQVQHRGDHGLEAELGSRELHGHRQRLSKGERTRAGEGWAAIDVHARGPRRRNVLRRGAHGEQFINILNAIDWFDHVEPAAALRICELNRGCDVYGPATPLILGGVLESNILGDMLDSTS